MNQNYLVSHHVFGNESLTVDKICELSKTPIVASFDDACVERMSRGRAIVEDVLRSGVPIYATTTGVGSQKEVAVGKDELQSFSDRMIVSEATIAPGSDFSDPIKRGALLVLCQNFARGGSGIGPELVRALVNLLASRRLPEVRRDCAFGVADLTPLSQLALPIIGRTLADPAGRATDQSVLRPKESVSLIDNNSFSLAEAAHVLRDCRDVLNAFDLAAATACEGFRAGLGPHTLLGAGGRRSAGQDVCRLNLSNFLADSALHEPNAARFLQDPLSFRGITQINGAAYEALSWATEQVETEINTSTDNPIVDLDRAVLVPSASMISVLPTLALDCLRQALAKVAISSHERSLKLQSPQFSGLPVGLAADGAADGGILSINLHYIAAARLGTLSAAGAPVFLHYIGNTADGVEDVSTLLPLSLTQTSSVIERAWELAILEMMVGVWAIARRNLPASNLGKGPRMVYQELVADLHIGDEGVRIFDFSAIINKVRTTALVERVMDACNGSVVRTRM